MRQTASLMKMPLLLVPAMLCTSALQAVERPNILVVYSERPDGMILARGGRAQGYALWLKQGRPAFTVVIDNKPITIQAKEAVTGWATVVGTITSDRQATLHVDGRFVADAALPGLIERNPNEAMQIGADLGSPVVEPVPPKFAGWIERVRLFSGEYKSEKP